MQSIQSDKKITQEGLQFVYLEGIGKCHVKLIDLELIEYGIDYILSPTKLKIS